MALYEARQALRPAMEDEAVQRMQAVYGDKYSVLTMFDAQRDVDKSLKNKQNDRSVRMTLRSTEIQKDPYYNKRKARPNKHER